MILAVACISRLKLLGLPNQTCIHLNNNLVAFNHPPIQLMLLASSDKLCFSFSHCLFPTRSLYSACVLKKKKLNSCSSACEAPWFQL